MLSMSAHCTLKSKVLNLTFKSLYNGPWHPHLMSLFILNTTQLCMHVSSMNWQGDPKVDAAAAAKSLQSCPTLCDPIDRNQPGSPVLGILQARILEWVAISFSKAWKWKVKVQSLSCVRLPATSWTAAYQALPSMGFSRQKYWSGLPLPSLLIGPTACNFNFQPIIFKYLLSLVFCWV